MLQFWCMSITRHVAARIALRVQKLSCSRLSVLFPTLFAIVLLWVYVLSN